MTLLPDQGAADSHLTDQLNQLRAVDALRGNMLGTAAAMSSVFLARHLAPQVVANAQTQAARTIKRYGNASCQGEGLQEAARKSINTALMLSSGLVTGIGSQVLYARKRRDEAGNEHPVSLGRDITRLMTGWSFGAAGASAAYYLAERYGHAHLIKAEQMLDVGLKGTEYVQGNRVSEGLVANAAMTVGAIPANVIGQRLYDTLLTHPAYDRAQMK